MLWQEIGIYATCSSIQTVLTIRKGTLKTKLVEFISTANFCYKMKSKNFPQRIKTELPIL